MKPRQPVHAHTAEDIDVQIAVVRRLGRIVEGRWLGYWVLRRGEESDRIDADVMYASEFRKARTEFRGTVTVAGMVATEIELGFAQEFLL